MVSSHVPLWPFAVCCEREDLGDHELQAILHHGTVGAFLSGEHYASHAGYKDGVRFVSQGCLGAAPRALFGMRQPSIRTITVLELEANGTVRIEAHGGTGFDRLVPRSTLPRKITAHGATMVRDNLAIKPVPAAASAAAR